MKLRFFPKSLIAITALVTSWLLASLEQTSFASTETPDVAFIKSTPIVDGVLDSELNYLIKKEFNYIFDFDNPVTEPVNVTYRMGYTATHLYLYIETDASEVSYHQRGYLWGDGYKLLLGLPQEGTFTNEYYEMTFSPAIEKKHMGAAHRIASYNFTASNKPFSDKTLSAASSNNERSGFEALIAWSDIQPYHPWFTKNINYNLYFAKGFNSTEYDYFTYGYAVIKDEGIWDEEIEHRAIAPLSFEQPNAVEGNILLTQATRRHILFSEKLHLKVISIGPKTDSIKLQITLLDSSGAHVINQNSEVDVTENLREVIIPLNTASLNPGTYTLLTTVKEQTFKDRIAILPDIEFVELRKQLEQNKPKASNGIIQTLLFKLHSLEQDLVNLKIYESGSEVLDNWKVFNAQYTLFTKGEDPYLSKIGPYRRGFKSDYDGSYQPYSIKLPEDYDASKSYPLLVFMHGSGEDEQTTLRRPRSNGEFIELAPYGRDRFRAYASRASQIDIVEAINAVSSIFPIDKDKIVIGGFSMGGYGALRAFYENPSLYKGVAVFAGHPNLASEWLDEDHPNFLNESYLGVFSQVPVFIYHGEKDAALDIGLIKKMSNKLEKSGAVVTRRFVPGRGHEYQDNITHSLYSNWLNQILRK